MVLTKAVSDRITGTSDSLFRLYTSVFVAMSTETGTRDVETLLVLYRIAVCPRRAPRCT